MTAGSSMLAMIRTVPPQYSQISMSIRNTRLRRCAQVMAWRGSGSGCFESALRRRPRPAGVMMVYTSYSRSTPFSGGARSVLSREAKMPDHRIRSSRLNDDALPAMNPVRYSPTSALSLVDALTPEQQQLADHLTARVRRRITETAAQPIMRSGSVSRVESATRHFLARQPQARRAAIRPGLAANWISRLPLSARSSDASPTQISGPLQVPTTCCVKRC